MLDELRALIALQSIGTISGAAVRLRITQSAVSKRIQALESGLHYKVVEKSGRKLRITPLGEALLVRAKPILLELEALKDLSEAPSARTLTIGISDSIASSWGPRLVRGALAKIADLKLEIHVHRSTMILENLRSARYELGIVTGEPQGSDLVWNLILAEQMILFGDAGTPKSQAPLQTIEMNSATWKEIGRQIQDHDRLRSRELIHVESFSAAIQMAKEGFGQALVPIGLARVMGLQEHEIHHPSPRIKRQVHLVARKSVANLKSVRELYESMRAFSV